MLERNFIFYLLLFFTANIWSQSSSPYTNIDFEASAVGAYTTANAVPGWSVSSRTFSSCSTSTVWNAGSSEFSIVATPILSFSGVGTIANSPLGGTKIAKLNGAITNSAEVRMSTTFTVSPNNTLFQFAVAGYWENGWHYCCENTGFKVNLKDCQGNLINPSCYN
ncbi:MAG: hypothetical protein IT236_12080, partial [Bacteroidia bacterium]|nr:hypothetical protein [Bacteroidia bacterium]